MVRALGPGPSVLKREPGAEPGRRCRREEEGGDGKPDRGRLRQAPTASSPETAANSAVELPGPPPAAGTRPCPASGAGAVGRRRASVDAGGGSLDCENVPRPAFPPPPEPWAWGARGGAKRGGLLRRDWIEKCWAKHWYRICGLEFPNGSGLKHTCVVAVDILVHLFIHPYFPPRPPFFLSVCFSCFTVKA